MIYLKNYCFEVIYWANKILIKSTADLFGNHRKSVKTKNPFWILYKFSFDQFRRTVDLNHVANATM